MHLGRFDARPYVLSTRACGRGSQGWPRKFAELVHLRDARRPARLRTCEGGHEVGEDSLSWLGRYMDWVDGTDGREEYHSFLRNRFASLEG